ncbi:probable carboxylesterase 2 [Coffea arabica]|uniref:Probable carboxylesterase 2 n=1 Tax=Coffea arabica TaxID=13443 RepID=A0A6P6WBR5_COFAR|nr:probable carboxylesterase 7 [Coffea arabica]
MSEIEFEFLPYFRSYKNGRVERFFGTDVVPASLGSETGVSSEDVTIVPENTTAAAVSARLFIPSSITITPDRTPKPKPKPKLPLLIYFHGGAYMFGSPFCATYHHYLTSVVASANVVAISIDYRLAPEHPLPAAFEDSWDALKWAASHSAGHGPEAWLNEYADFQRAFVAGDSAGSTIAHAMAVRAGEEEGLGGVKLVGLGVIHPDFASKKGGLSPTAAWNFACPATAGWDDPRINPAADSRLSRLGCERVLICVAEFDEMKERGWLYYDVLKESGWKGKVEILETPGEGHAFHLFNPTCTNAVTLLKKLASFLHQEE